MKPTIFTCLFFAAIACAGCDQVLQTPIGPAAGGDYLSWMQSMNKITVIYTGMTDIHTYLKQGTLDPGNSSDLWLTTDLEFENRDSTYDLVWQDSQFSTKSCFVFRQSNPIFTFSGDCGDRSLISGIYHGGTNSITNLWCMFEKYIGGTDPNNYAEQSASLAVPSFEMDSYNDDSIVFTVKNWKAGSIMPAYNYDEHAYGTYIKQRQLIGYDTSGIQNPSLCRVVLFKN